METTGHLLQLSEGDIDKFDEHAFEILSKTGIHVPEDQFLSRMSEAGFEVRREDRRILFDRALCEEYLAKVPGAFTLGGRSEEDDLALDGSSMLVRPQSGCPNVLDTDTGACRPAVLRDVERMAVLNDSLPHIRLAASLLYPSDIQSEHRDLAALVTILKNSRKHVYVQPYTPESMERMVEIAVCLRGSPEEVRRRSPLTVILGGTSPLVFSPNEIGVLRIAAENGIPIMCGSTPMNGATGPVTLAGEIVLHHAENLAGLVFSQVILEGAPVSYGIRPSTMDIRTGASVWGSVEWGMMTAALLQIAASHGFLRDTVGLSTDSKLSDAQAGMEKGMSALFSALWGANVAAGAGFIETIMTGSYEQMVIDNDLAGIMERVRRGIPVDEERLATSLIEEIGPGGNYLTDPHTLKFMREEVFIPGVLDRNLRYRWKNEGSRETAAVARERARGLIDSHTVPAFPEEIAREIDRIAGLS